MGKAEKMDLKSERTLKGKRKAFFFLNEKGGVGKTTAARVTHEFAIANGVKCCAYDCDPATGKFSSANGLKDENGRYDLKLNRQNPFKGVDVIDLRDHKQIDKIADALDENADWYIFDCPGGVIDVVKNIYGSVGRFVDEFNHEGVEVVIVIVFDTLRPSAQSVVNITNVWGDKVHYITVKAGGQSGQPAFAFPFFDGAYAFKANNPAETIKRLGGSVIRMPYILEDTFAIVDDLEMPFLDVATGDRAVTGLGRGEQGRVRIWLMEEMFPQLAELDLL